MILCFHGGLFVDRNSNSQASSGVRTSSRPRALSGAALRKIAADADKGKGKGKKRPRSQTPDGSRRPGVISYIPSAEEVKNIEDRMLGRISNGASSRR